MARSDLVSSIGLAVSADNLNFRKLKGHILDNDDIGYTQMVPPIVFRVSGFTTCVFADKPKSEGLRIYIAYSDDLKGLWLFL